MSAIWSLSGVITPLTDSRRSLATWRSLYGESRHWPKVSSPLSPYSFIFPGKLLNYMHINIYSFYLNKNNIVLV